ncbi:MAG: NUDIX hydrolase [Candidatus Methylumidiphilus sp.]
MFQHFIKTLLQELPRYAEEEGDFYSVPRHVLIDAIVRNHAVETGIAENTVLLCEHLLDTLAVLQVGFLSRGEWCFVSFPAQLLAVSVLTALSDRESRLFAANFWNTQGVSIDKKEQQHAVLHAIEEAREAHHATRQAPPIRYCYVAWSIIKLDGNILFYQREDTKKRNDKTAGDYGLIGGRANQTDMTLTDTRAQLQALQSPHSATVKAALPTTLRRELLEETGLQLAVHYTFKPWRSLRPYRQVQGAAPNHALTEYYLDIFQIELTLDGYLFLQQRVESDERLVWFTLEDLQRGETTDGKTPYIQALRDDFDKDWAALGAALAALPDSFSNQYQVTTEKYGLLLPGKHTLPLRAGVLGKEKPLDLRLDAGQFAMVLGLAAHLRGFEFAAPVQDITFHPYGWVEAAQYSAIQLALSALAAAVKHPGVVIECRHDTLFRLSVAPDSVYFDDSLFVFSVNAKDRASTANKIPVTVRRASFLTAFGEVQQKAETFKLSTQFVVNDLRKLAENRYSNDNDEAIRIEDLCKKTLHKKPAFLALGLRNLIRREDGMIKFVLDFVVDAGDGA